MKLMAENPLKIEELARPLHMGATHTKPGSGLFFLFLFAY